MTDIRRAREALVARILEGAGVATPAERRAAFRKEGPGSAPARLVGKVAVAAAEVSDADFAAARAAGASEDRLFELVIAAAVGEAVRQDAAARAALAAAAGAG
jgi:hypothetical protein